MSASRSEGARIGRSRDGQADEVEAVAEDLIVLVEEFETAISRGRVPAGFTERLSELREATQRLLDR